MGRDKRLGLKMGVVVTRGGGGGRGRDVGCAERWERVARVRKTRIVDVLCLGSLIFLRGTMGCFLVFLFLRDRWMGVRIGLVVRAWLLECVRQPAGEAKHCCQPVSVGVSRLVAA